MSATILCANHGCPSSNDCARYTNDPTGKPVYPFATDDRIRMGDFVPNNTGRRRVYMEKAA